MKIIYDVGANNGDDIPYYLQKADMVVAIEANPGLAKHISSRFPSEVAEGRLVVENYVITTGKSGTMVPFYISKQHHVLSQFTPPKSGNFEKITLVSKNLVDIVRQYGSPHYIKIDVENLDHEILKNLFSYRIFPPYISAESHSVQVFAALISMGGYDAFKLVEGRTVSEVYANHKIATMAGEKEYSFPHHSAGPYGNDVMGEWQTGANFLKTMADAGMGWKDIHASNIDTPLD